MAADSKSSVLVPSTEAKSTYENIRRFIQFHAAGLDVPANIEPAVLKVAPIALSIQSQSLASKQAPGLRQQQPPASSHLAKFHPDLVGQPKPPISTVWLANAMPKKPIEYCEAIFKPFGGVHPPCDLEVLIDNETLEPMKL